ncbi:MAG: GNAT family N-acetyltransferase [Inquilinus sp.]|nr:GNAT family N-acetyltransferase [Inquilinus sp.]
MKPRIRPAVPADARRIAELANLLSVNEGLGPDVFSEAIVLRDGFGETPAFSVLLAESGGEIVGYALFTDGYNTDIAARSVFLEDIFVVEPARGRGVGRRLFVAVARAAVGRGASSLWWGVRSSNRRARDFYGRLGAVDEDARILQFDGERLAALAAEDQNSRSNTTG